MKERIEDGSQVLFLSQKGGMMTRMQFTAIREVRSGGWHLG